MPLRMPPLLPRAAARVETQLVNPPTHHHTHTLHPLLLLSPPRQQRRLRHCNDKCHLYNCIHATDTRTKGPSSSARTRALERACASSAVVQQCLIA